jgi:protein phosphatase 1L
MYNSSFGIVMPQQVSTSPSLIAFSPQASPQPNNIFSQATAVIVENKYVKSVIGRSGEDRYVTAILNNTVNMYGVFDGHAGKEVSEYLMNNLPQALAQFLLNVNFADELAVKNAITNAYVDIDKKMFGLQLRAGSTAVVALYFSGILYLINLGDSRAIVFTGEGNIMLETQDHKPEKERQRIVSAGGFVTNLNPSRVNGILAVSRAFGDFILKDYPKYNYQGPVSVIPDIIRSAHHTPVFILLASDGLFDVLSSQEAVNIILKSKTAISACEELIEIARKHTNDDITTMIVRL